MRRAGFTLIEVLITITIMAILMIMAVVLMRNNESNGRDAERKTDATTIAQQLETFYTSGTDNSTLVGFYPRTDDMNSEANIEKNLRDLDWRALRAPGVPTTSAVSLIVASSAGAQTPTVSQYIYQPLNSSGTLCSAPSTDCRKFNLYYTLENGGTQVIASRNQ